jgi:folate-binding protein YgfZ
MTDPSTRDLGFRAAERSAVVSDATELAVLRIEGEDAAGFLQGQLSNDVAALAADTAQWSSYNSPKGRMLANLRLWRDSEGFGALISADLVAAIRKRLSMFVLRAKVRVDDLSSSHAVLGVGGPDAATGVAKHFAIAPIPDGVATSTQPRATIVGLDERRFVLVTHAASAAALQSALAGFATPVAGDVWRWLAIAAGVPLVSAATSDRFVPQMLNWDALGGISFQKGCYPGQEIVARMRYLGRLKERLYGFRVTASREPLPGARVYRAASGETSCGTVVNAAPSPDGGYALLAVVQVSAIEAGALALDGTDGPALVRVPLPYPLTDAAPARPLR